ncbi:hypothetical protein HRE96_12760 [Enterococcus faecalis]|nr:hypothetical protein [Enterococcus faecalis]
MKKTGEKQHKFNALYWFFKPLFFLREDFYRKKVLKNIQICSIIFLEEEVYL